MSELIIGIDLGTTNSLAAQVTSSGPEVIENDSETTQIPSVVTLLSSGDLVGAAARKNRLQYPESTFYSFKRFMGRGAKDVAEDLSSLPFPVSIGERDNILLGEADRRISPEEMSAKILLEIKRKAEAVLGQEVKKAVITVPAYFDDAQRQATRDAAQLAGLEVMRIINEPTAAAIAYGLNEKKTGKIAVYDFGGGTFDVSILDLKGKLFKVLSTHGDTHLGGDDLDQLIVQKLVALLKPQAPGLDWTSPAIKQTLKKFSEEFKIQLSNSLEVTLEFSFPQADLKTNLTLSREELDQAIQPKVQETLDHVTQALAEANLTAQDINEVVLVGGSSRIPLVRKMVGDYFSLQPHIRLNPDQVVSLGAAIQGHLLAGGSRDYLLMDVVPLSLGLETVGGTFSKLIMKNSSIPAKATEIFSTSADNQTGIELNIYQGEREFVRDCRRLGKFILKGIPAMPAGLPRVEVSFFVDTNGLLTVSAKELRSKVESQIDIIPSHGLKRSEISQMIRDSMEYAMDDFTERNLVEFREKTTAILEGIDKIWDKAHRFISQEQMDKIQAHRKVLEEIQQGPDPLKLKAAIDHMGDLTRDLADSIMGDAAKETLLND
ncbi:MAG: molecular chaperone HscA [SAR324 cluster bacterium]|uniref:Molecular chaperone HscA n=1 Tax=SAR324 cluster bacterium TaxID=2024889 RepID=A0A2A4TB04_9DELT|nr:MAG: molecular chaperone HscA [SAR324 cluster bacterium]